MTEEQFMGKFNGLWENISRTARMKAKKLYKTTAGVKSLKNDYTLPRMFLSEILQHIDKNYRGSGG